MAKKALLVLEDGKTFEGTSYGYNGESGGEIVFNTAMTGYQEILTDPSYKGQLVTMTYTEIGNYGVNTQDVESSKIYCEGFIIREGSPVFSNWRSNTSLSDYLISQEIPCIEGIDTRELTRHLRDNGSKRGIISTTDLNPESLVKKAKALPEMAGLDLAKEVTCSEAYDYVPSEEDITSHREFTKYEQGKTEGNGIYKVAVYDFGIKLNILRELNRCGCRIRVFPAGASFKEVEEWNPDGIFLSNGPGDPEPVKYAIENIKKLYKNYPVFGICLGHQLLGIALGGKTYKLKFGHHGANHPVKDLSTGKIEITSQNHGFAVDMDSFKNADAILTHTNLNDQTVEGLRHKKLPVFSVQYHPEASPGPHDSKYLFKRFIENMKNVRKK